MDSTRMLGGDLESSASGVMGELAAALRKTDGVAEAYPRQSFQIVDALQMGGQRVGAAGSTVDHMPALRKAQVGIALSNASDAAREAAQVVMAKPGLAAIIAAVATAREIFVRVRTYCVYRVAGMFHITITLFVTSLFNPSSFFACAGYVDGNGECTSPAAAMSVPVTTVLLIAFLNDFCMVTIARDSVDKTKRPQRWRLVDLFASSATLGLLASVGSLGLLLICLRAGDHVDVPDGPPVRPAPFAGSGDGSFACILFEESSGQCTVSYGQTMAILCVQPFSHSLFLSLSSCNRTLTPTFASVSATRHNRYLRLALGDLFTIYAARTRCSFFTRLPSPWLVVATLGAFAAYMLLTSLLPVIFGAGDAVVPQRTLWLVVAYSALCFFAQDAVKCVAFGLFRACAKASEQVLVLLEAEKARNDDARRVNKYTMLSTRRSGLSGASTGSGVGTSYGSTPSRAFGSGEVRAPE
jgi:magnesium-transporting ATPase (P-type)